MTSPTPTRSRVLEVVLSALDEVNAARPPGKQVARDEQAALFGLNGRLDSLGLVGLIVAVEQRLAEELGAVVTLADEKALSQRNSPFRSVASLTDYVCQLLAPAARQ